MIIQLNGFTLQLSLLAGLHGDWAELPLTPAANGASVKQDWISATLELSPNGSTIGYQLSFSAEVRTRLRLRVRLVDETNLFHLIPGNIFGDNRT